MTKKELIEALAHFPDDMQVFTNNFFTVFEVTELIVQATDGKSYPAISINGTDDDDE